MDQTFDPTPAQDEAQWRDTERGLDARHRAKKKPKSNGQVSQPVRVKLDVEFSPAVCTPGYAPRYLADITLNTAAQRGTLKLLTASLTARDEILLDGTPVKHPQQAIQCLLAKLAVGLPQPVLDYLMAGVEW